MQSSYQETGFIKQNPKGRLTVLLAYPNKYRVGMGSLAIHYLYSRLNSVDGIVCERAFLPESSSERLVSVENGRPFSQFCAILFSVSFENDFQNIVRMCEKGGVEPRASERDAPLIIAGGAAATLHPHALQNVADAIFVGEADDAIEAIAHAIGSGKSKAPSELAKIKGMYVPGLMKEPPKRACVSDLDRWPVHTVIDSPKAEFGQMFLIEMGRGCPYACKFCTVPLLYRPCRQRSFDALWKMAQMGLSQGKRLGLVSPCVLSHPAFEELAQKIIDAGGQFSTSSLRADEVTPGRAALLAKGGMKSISLGVETGDEQMRFALGKRITDTQMIEAARLLSDAGIKKLKLYFIVGLPDESRQDLLAIVSISGEIKKAMGKGAHVEAVLSQFVPKKGSALGDAPFAARRYMIATDNFLRRELSKIAVRISYRSLNDAKREYEAGQRILLS